MDNENNTRLGRGLSSMVGEVAGIKAGSSAGGSGYLRIPLNDIREAGRGRHADAGLIESIKKAGVLHPVLVARVEGGYALLAGSRRLHGARAAGLADIPALIIPPDRAGALDVYLDENLARAELSESDRIALRERWMRETGRDLEQAEERIPEVQWETTQGPAIKTPRLWMAAAGVMAVVSSILLVMVFNAKPVDKRPVVIPVAFVEAPIAAPPDPVVPDTRWMEAFRFPGAQRETEGQTLRLFFPEGIFENDALTSRGRLVLNQLAALNRSVEGTFAVTITAPGPAGGEALAHLIREGLEPSALALHPGLSDDLRIAITSVP